MDDSGILLRKMHSHLELCGLDQLEYQTISVDQLVPSGKPSPSCSEDIGTTQVPGEVGCAVLMTLLILQRDSLVLLRQVLPAERNWEGLQFRNGW